jgi:hypothetical protein
MYIFGFHLFATPVFSPTIQQYFAQIIDLKTISLSNALVSPILVGVTLAENTLKKFHIVSTSQIDWPTWTKQVIPNFWDRASVFPSLNFT